MPQRICLCFLLAICALQVSAQPTVSQVWVKPDNPTKGSDFSYVVLGAFDPKTVVATLFGPGCDKGCELKITGEKTADRLSGSWKTDFTGAFQIEVRNGDGAPAKRMDFCTVAIPRIARIWTKPDPPDPDSPFEILIAGEGFDSASATAVFQNSACTKGPCGSIGIASRSFDFLAGKAPALPGGKYTVAVKNARDPQPALFELAVTPKLDPLSTVPATPTRNAWFRFTFVGKGFWPGQSRIVIFDPTFCPKGCPPNGWNFLPQSTTTRLDGNMWLAQPGTFEVGVESGGAISNLVKLEVK